MATIDQVLNEVGNDPEKARVALEKEHQGANRVTLVEELQGIIDRASEPVGGANRESGVVPDVAPIDSADTADAGEPDTSSGEPKVDKLYVRSQGNYVFTYQGKETRLPYGEAGWVYHTPEVDAAIAAGNLVVEESPAEQ